MPRRLNIHNLEKQYFYCVKGVLNLILLLNFDTPLVDDSTVAPIVFFERV